MSVVVTLGPDGPSDPVGTMVNWEVEKWVRVMMLVDVMVGRAEDSVEGWLGLFGLFDWLGTAVDSTGLTVVEVTLSVVAGVEC